jgi:hypothetical protein
MRVANRSRRPDDLLLLLIKRIESSNIAHAAVIFQIPWIQSIWNARARGRFQSVVSFLLHQNRARIVSDYQTANDAASMTFTIPEHVYDSLLSKSRNRRNNLSFES